MENQSGSGRRAREMRKDRRNKLLILLVVIAVLIVFFVVLYSGKFHKVWDPNENIATETTTISDYEEWERIHIQDVIAEAERIAQGYDFEAAVKYLKSDEYYRKTLEMLEKAEEIKNREKDMVAWRDIKDISSLCIRPLVHNTEVAFAPINGHIYEQQNITTEEFKKLLNELYERGYVLVSLHDITASKVYKNSLNGENKPQTMTEVTTELTTEETTTEETTTEETTSDEETDEDSTEKKTKAETTTEDPRTLKKGKIMLPAGKTPLVLSEENVCYTADMALNGFASKFVLTKDGKVTCQMSDGTVGAFDLVPILEEFIDQHPDFSYKGARAVLGVTGSEGIFGYNTTYANHEAADYNDNVDMAKRIADSLKQMGYELAMNGYHYSNMGEASIDINTFKSECNNWLSEVAPIVGVTDIISFPNGDDIGDWHYYSGERYEFLNAQGYVYYLNMNSSERAWNQILNFYIRQGRRMVSGYLLEKEYAGARNFDDMFDAADVISDLRNVVGN